MEAYFDPKSPGSFGGVDRLYRLLKGQKTKAEVREWLSGQPTYSMHKPVRRKFRRNATIVHNINEQFQADLVDVSLFARTNGGFHFLLTCIDVFSKVGWAVPMKNKSAKSTKEAFQQIFAERKPQRLQTDRGKEFDNAEIKAYMEEEGVELFFAWNTEIKCAVVERFNQTLKGRMWRYMTYANTTVYFDVLSDILKSYNNSYHRSIKMAPYEVNENNVKLVWENLYGHLSKSGCSMKPIKFKYKLGDFVRLSEGRVVFKKGYVKGWTEEVFVVSKQSPRDPVVYKIRDLEGEEIKGSFYEPELQKIPTPELFEIEQVIRKKGEGKNLKFYVKWVDYPESQNNWVSLRDIVIL
jgi:Integrase core domain